MNIVDIVIIIIFASSIVIGFGRGFIKEVISFLSLIAAIVLAIVFSNQFATAMTNSPTVQHLIGRSSEAIHASTTQPASYIAIGISFFLIFIGVLLIGAILGFLLNSIFQFGGLGFGNRFFGAIFGLIRAFIFTMIIVFIIQLTSLSEEPWWKESRFVVAAQPVIQWLDNTISPALADFKSKVGEKLENAVTPSSKDSESNSSSST